MNIIFSNIQFMTHNIFLAIIPIVFGWLMIHTKTQLLKILYGMVWLIFLPNTIYLLTDITHFVDDWSKIALVYKGFFIIEYALLMLTGIFTFILALYPLEQLFPKTKSKKKKQRQEIFLYAVNFLVGFGIVLGRIERINSWEIITNTSNVLYEVIHTLTSVNLVLFVIFFGLICNIVYFSFRDTVIDKFSLSP